MSLSPSTPPAATSGASASPQAVGYAQLKPLGEVVVEAVPDRLQNLSRTIVISGTIVAQNKGNSLTIKTQVGEIVIRSETPLPLDKLISLQIPPGAPPVRAIISMIVSPAPSPVISAAASPTATNLTLPSPQQTLSLPDGSALLSGDIRPQITATQGPPLLDESMQAVLQQSTTAQTTSIKSFNPLQQLVVPGSLSLAMVMSLPQIPELMQMLETLPIQTLKGDFLPVIMADLALKPQTQFAPHIDQTNVQSSQLQNSNSTLHNTPTSGQNTFTPQTTPQTDPLLRQLPDLQNPAALPAPTVLTSVKHDGLQQLIAQLPTAVLSPAASTTSPLPTPPLPHDTLFAPTHFTLLPSAFTLPPGAQLTLQIETLILPTTLSTDAPPTLNTASPSIQTTLEQQTTIPLKPSSLLPPDEASTLPTSTSSPINYAASTTAPLAAQTTNTPLLSPSVQVMQPPTYPVLSGQVMGATPKNEVLVNTAAGVLVLAQHPSNLPVGTHLTISILHVDEPPIVSIKDDIAQGSPKDWSSLQQIAALAQQEPFLLQIARNQPTHIGSQLIFLLAALGFKEPKSLLGEDILNRLRNARKPELLEKLADDISQNQQTWSRLADTPLADWKSVHLPLPQDSSFLRLAVHFRDEPQEKQSTHHETAQHLVVELELTRLGPMILDGLIYRKRLEMTLHTQRTLPSQLQKEIDESFQNALSGLAWSGSIRFHTAAQLWQEAFSSSQNIFHH